MKSKRNNKLSKITLSASLALSLALAAILTTEASSFAGVNILGGVSLGTGAANDGMSAIQPLAGAELTFGVGGVLELGGFYDHNFQSYDSGTSGTLRFFGGMARLGFGPASDLKFDGKIGLTSSSAGGSSSDSVLGIGAGLSYLKGLGPLLSVGPRLGVRTLPFSSGEVSLARTMFDLGVMLSVGF